MFARSNGNATEFDSGRQFAAWLGLVPGQYSSGGKARLGRITKAGDAYLRGECLVNSMRQLVDEAACCPRLTIEAPARVFHQGPQHLTRCINDRL